MAKKQSESSGILGCLVILIIASIASTVYAFIIVIPPILLFVGIIRYNVKCKKIQSVSSIIDFELNDKESEQLQIVKDEFIKLSNTIEELHQKGSSTTKRKDGMYSERSKLGKELNQTIPGLEQRADKAKKIFFEIKSLPEKRLQNWLKIKSKRMAYNISFPLVFILFYYFSSFKIDIISNVYNLITLIPKAISLGCEAIIIQNVENADQWPIFKIYEFYPEYHAPIVVASALSFVVFIAIFQIYKRILHKKLQNKKNLSISNAKGASCEA